jgi:uncharacterized protein YqgC (DUF456 family)
MFLSAFSLLIIFSVLGFLAIFFTSFGTFIILLGAMLFSWMTEFVIFDPGTLIIFFLLYGLGEVLEYVFTALGAKSVGASNAAVVGAILGGVVGAMFGVTFFGIGIFAATFLGIFFGAFLMEYLIHRDLERSLFAGLGSLAGRVGSIFVKVLIAIVIYAIMGTKIFMYYQTLV